MNSISPMQLTAIRSVVVVTFMIAGPRIGLPEDTTAGQGYSVSLPAFRDYFPPEIFTIDQLPDEVRRKADQVVARSLNSELQQATTLVSYAIIDPSRGSSAGFVTRISYVLHYRVLLRHDWAKFFDFLIELDHRGDLASEPLLPGAFQSKDFCMLSAQEILEKSHLDVSLSRTAELRFDHHERRLLWRFSRYEKKLIGRDQLKVWIIDALSGDVVDIRTLHPRD